MFSKPPAEDIASALCSLASALSWNRSTQWLNFSLLNWSILANEEKLQHEQPFDPKWEKELSRMSMFDLRDRMYKYVTERTPLFGVPLCINPNSAAYKNFARYYACILHYICSCGGYFFKTRRRFLKVRWWLELNREEMHYLRSCKCTSGKMALFGYRRENFYFSWLNSAFILLFRILLIGKKHPFV